jgi:putative inorganic carbon (hco3(-)) transporter
VTALSAPLGRNLERGALRRLLLTACVVGLAIALSVFFGAVPLAAIGLTATAVLAVVSLAKPNVTTYLALAILYSNAAAIVVHFHGVPAVVGLAMPAMLAIPLGYHLLVRRATVTITSAFPFLLAYLLAIIVSAIFAADTRDAAEMLVVFLIGGLGLYFALTNVVRTWSVLRGVVWVLVLAGGAIGALSAYQVLTNSYDTQFFGFAQIDPRGDPVRLAGPIGEKNRYAQIMVVLLPLGATLAYSERRRGLRYLALLLTALILVAMVSTYTRGAAIGLAAVLVAALLFRYIRPMHLALVLAVAAATLFAFPHYGDRLLNLQALTQLDRSAAAGAAAEGDLDNLRARATHAMAAFYVFLDHPVVGVGRGQFSNYHQQYAGRVDELLDIRLKSPTMEAHNLYTGLAAELGALGLLAFLGIVWVTMRDLIRARRRWLTSRPEIAHLATGFWLALLAYLASGMTLHLNYERYFWVLVALAGITAHLALRGEDGGSEPARPTKGQREYSQSV